MCRVLFTALQGQQCVCDSCSPGVHAIMWGDGRRRTRWRASARGTASAKVLGLVVLCSTTNNGNNDDDVTGTREEGMRSEGVGRGQITPGLAGHCRGWFWVSTRRWEVA